MTASTVKLHRTLIRLAKGMLSAWEVWLEEFDPASKKK